MAVIWVWYIMPYSNNHYNDGAATKLMLYKALLNALKQNKKQAKNNPFWSIRLRKGLQQLWDNCFQTGKQKVPLLHY